MPHGSTPVYLEPWRCKTVEYLSWGTLLEFSGKLLQRRHKGVTLLRLFRLWLKSGTSWGSHWKPTVWSSLWYLLLVVCCLYPGHQVCTAIKVNYVLHRQWGQKCSTVHLLHVSLCVPFLKYGSGNLGGSREHHWKNTLFPTYITVKEIKVLFSENFLLFFKLKYNYII